MSNARRVLIIGLDGATFDLLNPWMAQGELPNLAALVACSGPPFRPTHRLPGPAL